MALDIINVVSWLTLMRKTLYSLQFNIKRRACSKHAHHTNDIRAPVGRKLST